MYFGKIVFDPSKYISLETLTELLDMFGSIVMSFPTLLRANELSYRNEKTYIYTNIHTLPFKSLGSLRNVFIFQRKALFFQ